MDRNVSLIAQFAGIDLKPPAMKEVAISTHMLSTAAISSISCVGYAVVDHFIGYKSAREVVDDANTLKDHLRIAGT